MERFHDPAAVCGGKDCLAADLDAGDVGRIEAGQHRLAVQLRRRALGSVADEVRRDAEDDRGRNENRKISVVHLVHSGIVQKISRNQNCTKTKNGSHP